MTQPVVVEVRQKGSTVEEGRGGGADVVAPELAAIQHRYEEARASIAGLADGSSDAAQDLAEPYPETQAIDVRLAKAPDRAQRDTTDDGDDRGGEVLAEQPEDESCPRDAGPAPSRGSCAGSCAARRVVACHPDHAARVP